VNILELLEPQYGVYPAEVHYLQGVLYFNGLGMPQNFDSAFDHFKIAAHAGLPAAQYAAGTMLVDGRGIDRDYEVGLDFLRQACSQSFVPALFYLGVLLSSQDAHSTEAFTLYSSAAKLGLPAAARAIAVAYDKGIGVMKSEKDALHWYECAASKGDCFSSETLAEAYREGLFGLRPDSKLASEWAIKAMSQKDQMDADEFERYKISASHGFRASQKILAMIFEMGTHGVKVDLAEAKYWKQRGDER
jgi:uncharacterized protein